LSLWISIAVLNNATDRTTNSFYLSQMTSMAAIHSDTSSGSGLLWRAIDLPWVGPALLYFVIVLQLCTAVLLLRAAVLHLQVLFGRKVSSDVANQAATIALSAFVGIWLFFMTGGFWFGYWLHMGAFQQVHMTLLIIGISSLIYLASTEPYLRNIS